MPATPTPATAPCAHLPATARPGPEPAGRTRSTHRPPRSGSVRCGNAISSIPGLHPGMLPGDGQDDAQQVPQRVRQALVGQLIPGPAAFWDSHDQAAPAQARQVVRHGLTRNPQEVRQVSRVRRRLPQRQQNARPRRVCQGVPEPCQHLPVARHHRHDPTIQRSMNTSAAELLGPALISCDRRRLPTGPETDLQIREVPLPRLLPACSH